MVFRNVLITGGAGFIGSHLAEALLRDGSNVTIIDDLSTGQWQNIDHLQQNPDFRAIIASASDRQLIFDEVAKHDFVYHLASAVGVKLIIEQPVKTVESIFHTTDVVLGACSRFRRPVLITSTSEVYGKSVQVPFREEDDVVMGPTEKRRWAYACAKALDEFLGLAHYYETNLPVYLVRLFNTVGARQSSQYGMVLPNFVRQALSKQPLTVYGNGQQRRCFCSVLDVVDGLMKLPRVAEAAGHVVNLGSQEEISIEALAQRVIQACQSSSTIEFIPYAEAYGPGFDDMLRRVPSLERAQRYIGWNPKYDLNQIIGQVIESVSQGPTGAQDECEGEPRCVQPS